MAVQSLERDDANASLFWDAVTGTDTGEVLKTPNGVLAGTVQLIDTGSFAGTVHLEGTLDGTNWAAIKDLSGTAIAMDAAGMFSFAAIVSAIRVRAASVTGTAQIRLKMRTT